MQLKPISPMRLIKSLGRFVMIEQSLIKPPPKARALARLSRIIASIKLLVFIKFDLSLNTIKDFYFYRISNF